MTMPPHLRAIVSGGALDATITFGEPRRFAPSTNRKRLTRALEEEVRAMTVAAHNGRFPETAEHSPQ